MPLGGEGDRRHLLSEALPIHAQEDPYMIQLLGRQKYIDIVTTAPPGWVAGVFGGPESKSRIYKCTMMQNRHQCVALYLEEEYEELALEAHFDCKRPDIPICNRPSFQCKYCKQCMKDKNTLSYHRMMNQCPGYKGKNLLKMYPTWNKSESKELTRLGEKHGKILPSKLKRANDGEVDLPNKWATLTNRRRDMGAMPPPWPKPPIEKEVYTLSSGNDFSLTPEKVKGKHVSVPKLSIPRKNAAVVTLGTQEKAKVPSQQNRSAAPFSGLPSTQSKATDLFSTPNNLPYRVPAQVSRADIEVRVRATTETFTRESSSELAPPPKEVQMNGLYVLLSETDKVMNRNILEDPEECMARLMKMETEGTLCSTLVAAFGQWYLYPPDNGGIERTVQVLDMVKNSLNAWTSGGGGENTMERFREMKGLREYLQYLKLKTYEAKKKEEFVLQLLENYDLQIRATEEKTKWDWSPLYSLLKWHPLKTGPQCPWVHTKEELQDILTELEKESELFSLEMECPHIVRAFKMFCRASFGRLHPLAHPVHGLTRCNVMHYSRELDHSVRLTIAVQDLINYGFVWFPKMHQSTEELFGCQQDLFGLLGFDHEQQNPVIEKIGEFMSKIAHRAVIDIHSAGKFKELEDMWCNATTAKEHYLLLDEVVNEALLLREDIDVGWIFIGKADSQEEITIREMSNKCRSTLSELRDCQLHDLMVKLRRVKDPNENTGNVVRTICIAKEPQDDEHVPDDEEVTIAVPPVHNITNIAKPEKVEHGEPDKEIGLNSDTLANQGECTEDGVKSPGLNDIRPPQPLDLFQVHVNGSPVQDQKENEVDLLQSYVNNPSPAKPIRTHLLPATLQPFTRTPSLSLELHPPGETSHSPRRPIPNFNDMGSQGEKVADPVPGVGVDVGASDKLVKNAPEGLQEKKCLTLWFF